MAAECFNIKKCLQIYENASGQLVNYEKSAITFSPSASSSTINTIQSIFSNDVVKGHELYLGLPTCSLRSKNDSICWIPGKNFKKINGWLLNYSLQVIKKLLLGQYYRLFHRTQCHVSNFLFHCAMSWNKVVLNSGGILHQMVGVCIGLGGGKCVNLSSMKVWGFGVFRNSIGLCWRNRFGG